MDKFLNLQNSRERLLKNYKEHQGLIIAFDFDNTVFNPETGDTQGCEDVISVLKTAKIILKGSKFICYSASENSRYSFIEEYCKNNFIPLDAVNRGFENSPNGDGKLYYNIFLDDRAGLLEAVETLKYVIKEVLKESWKDIKSNSKCYLEEEG